MCTRIHHHRSAFARFARAPDREPSVVVHRCAPHVHTLTASAQPSPGLPVPLTVRATRCGSQSLFVVMNGTLYFKAISYAQSTGYELWMSDGTALGTEMVSVSGFDVRLSPTQTSLSRSLRR